MEYTLPLVYTLKPAREVERVWFVFVFFFTLRSAGEGFLHVIINWIGLLIENMVYLLDIPAFTYFAFSVHCLLGSKLLCVSGRNLVKKSMCSNLL